MAVNTPWARQSQCYIATLKRRLPGVDHAHQIRLTRTRPITRPVTVAMAQKTRDADSIGPVAPGELQLKYIGNYSIPWIHFVLQSVINLDYNYLPEILPEVMGYVNLPV